ncbi:hypothetical protein ACLOJK_028329, partial [Asimina triloba]
SPPPIPFAIVASSSGESTPFRQWTTGDQHPPHSSLANPSLPSPASSTSLNGGISFFDLAAHRVGSTSATTARRQHDG